MAESDTCVLPSTTEASATSALMGASKWALWLGLVPLNVVATRTPSPSKKPNLLFYWLTVLPKPRNLGCNRTPLPNPCWQRPAVPSNRIYCRAGKKIVFAFSFWLWSLRLILSLGSRWKLSQFIV